jgi:hypothetical protein
MFDEPVSMPRDCGQDLCLLQVSDGQKAHRIAGVSIFCGSIVPREKNEIQVV